MKSIKSILVNDNNIIFEMSHAEKWQGAAHAMGIEVWQLSPQAGHA